MKKWLWIWFWVWGMNGLSGQIIMQGDLQQHVAGIISGLPGAGSNEYQVPSAAQLASWDTLVTGVLSGNYATAAANAAALQYNLVEFTDTTGGPSSLYYILEKTTAGSNYWGTYIFNPAACRSNVAILCPHPKYDTKTGNQGIFVFHETDAGYYFVSGTHRCNQTDSTTCSGTTGACGATGAFRLSDNAHNVDAIFQQTTVSVNENTSNTVFIELHGFAMGSGDPYVIMSNGTRSTPNPDYIALLRNGLYMADTVLTFKIAHIDLSWTKLIAFTNTQGRYLNNSGNPCNNSATVPSGQFIHIEQEKTRLRDDTTGWNKMSVAIEYAFPCTPVFIDPNFEISEPVFYPVPFDNLLNVSFPFESDWKLVLYSLTGQKIIEQTFTGTLLELNTDKLNNGMYIWDATEANGTRFTGKLIK